MTKIDKYKIKLSFCHRIPERSFFYKGKQFPVCSRCTGIHIGYLTFPLFLFSYLKFNLLFTMIMILPPYLDGVLQAYSKWESNNFLRVITGLIAGIGSMSLVSIIGKQIGLYILININK